MASPEVKFALKLASDAGRGVAVLLAGVGDRLGLFSALNTGPATPEELAERAAIDPRYAREWLHAMAAAGYVEREGDRYALPPPQAEVLAREGSVVFMGGTLQMLLGMIAPFDRLRDAFRTGKGIPFEAYPPDAWEGMERDMAGLYETQLVSEWLPRVPAVKGLLEGGALAADIGCGRGRAIFALARAFPKARLPGALGVPRSCSRPRSAARPSGSIESKRAQKPASLPFSPGITRSVMTPLAWIGCGTPGSVSVSESTAPSFGVTNPRTKTPSALRRLLVVCIVRPPPE